MRFRYNAKDQAGKLIQGILEAESQDEIINRLQGLGYFPLEITPIIEKKPISLKGLFGQRISRKEIAAFTRQLADLIDSGVPMIKGMDLLHRQSENQNMKNMLSNIRSFIEEGGTLHEALEHHPKYFSRLYIGMVNAGEVGGFLPEVLNQLADFFEQEADLKGKVMASLTYPVVMILVCIAVVLVLVTFVIPKFKMVFENMGQDLPWNTVLILNISNFMQEFFPILFIGGTIGIFALIRLLKRPSVQLKIDHLTLTMPLIKEIILKKELIHFCRVLNALLRNGITLIPSLEIVAGSIENKVLAAEIEKLPVSISKGQRFAQAMEKCPYFPVLMVNMIAISEESSRIDHVLFKLANSYEKEVNRLLKMLTSLIEPTIIVIMAVIVGFIVSGMILPMFSLNVGG